MNNSREMSLYDSIIELKIEVERLRVERDVMKNIAIESLENLAHELQFGDPGSKARGWFMDKYFHGIKGAAK